MVNYVASFLMVAGLGHFGALLRPPNEGVGHRLILFPPAQYTVSTSAFFLPFLVSPKARDGGGLETLS